MKEMLEGLPGWVKWVAIPLVALFVFGGFVTSVLGFLFGLLFKVLLFVALVGALILVVKKFGAGSGRD